MSTYYYIGLDIHKRTISYCVKKVDGTIIQQGTIAAERKALHRWIAEVIWGHNTHCFKTTVTVKINLHN